MYEKTATHWTFRSERMENPFVCTASGYRHTDISAGARYCLAATTNGFKIVRENGKKVCYYYKNGKKRSRIPSCNHQDQKKYYFDEKGQQVTGWQKGENGRIYPLLL